MLKARMFRLTAVGALILLTSCGGLVAGNGGPAAGTPSGQPSSHADFDRGQDDWRNPISGVPVATPDAAQPKVPFSIYVPKGLGEPASLFVSPDDMPLAGRAVAFVFDTPDFGTVDVVEHVPETPPDQYEQEHRSFLAYNGDPLTHGSFEIVTAPNGTEALLTIGEGGTPCVMFWLEGDAEIVLKGPSLTRDQILQIAASL